MRLLASTSLWIILLLAASANVHAQYYGGVSLGNDRQRVQSGFNGGDAPAELAALGDMVVSKSGLNLSSEPSIGIKLGYRYTPYFSVEGRFAGRAAAASIFPAEADARRIQERTMGLDLVGTLPIVKKFSLLGRAGYRNESFSANDNGALPPAPRGINSGVIGLGVQYNFNASVGLRFEVERARKFFTDRSNVDADNVSFGVFWRF